MTTLPGPPDPRVELALYVCARSLSGVKARHNLETLLARFRDGQVRLVVYDLERDSAHAEADRIIFTPTLVKKSPEPPAWIVGDLGDGAPLVALLRSCGVEES